MDLHIFFLPFLAPGHMIPIVDLAHLFAGRGVKATIVTTSANVPLIQPSLDLANAAANLSLLHPVEILPLRFPSSESGVPEGHENLVAFNQPSITPEFMAAIGMLEAPFKQLVQDHRPDAVVADLFYSWAPSLAQEFGIPNLCFHGSNTFLLAMIGALSYLKPQESEQAFDVPGLPHRIRLSWLQLPQFLRRREDTPKLLGEALRGSYGTVVNSFYELEFEYIDLINKVNDSKPRWHVGPLSLCSRQYAAVRGNRASVNTDECLKWLERKKPRSVLYICFGSLGDSTTEQLREIALALEASACPFLWVVKHAGELPKGFEERVTGDGKGLILEGWVPQLLILNHEAVGGFMTHCGWNSCMEAVSAGVPVITWPLFAEQFFNEKLMVDVRMVGVAVGATVCSEDKEERGLVEAEKIKKAVEELMGNGAEAEERRKRARRLQEMATEAIGEGGSSHLDFSRLLDDLLQQKAKRSIGLGDAS